MPDLQQKARLRVMTEAVDLAEETMPIEVQV